MGLLGLLFSFNGRINRAQYWLGSLGVGVAGAMLIFAIAMLSGASMASAKTAGHAFGAVMGFLVLLAPILLVMSWCGFAIQVKRFHDRGRTGYLCLIPFVVMLPMFFTLFAGLASGADPVTVANSVQPFMLVMWLINLWFFVDLGCLPGKDGPNRYGDPPGSPRASSPHTRPAQGAPSAAVAASSSLFGAQSAMDRAIAERAKPQAAPAPASAPRRATPATPRPAAPGGFGRKPTH